MSSMRILRIPALGLLLLGGTAALADDQEAGDPVRGKQQFAPCTSCHALEAEGPAKVGPSLHGLLGSQAGSRPGFTYSAALKASGLVWDEKTLDAWIAGPAALVPGNQMAYPGISNDETRANIIAYLKQATR